MLLFLVACAQQSNPAPEPIAQPVVPPVTPPVAVPVDQPTVQPVTQPVVPPVAQPTTPPPATSPNTHQVRISGFKFVPSSLTVNVGDTVMWTNDDGASHTVKLPAWESDEMLKGDTSKWTFKKAGTFDYICGLHPSMKGSITVV